MKKLLNYSLLTFLCSLFMFACSREDGEMSPNASLESSKTQYASVGDYDIGCLNYENGEWSFGVKGPGNVSGAGLSHLNLELLDCEENPIHLEAGDITDARIVVGSTTYTMPSDFVLQYTDGSCSRPGEQKTGIVKFEIKNSELNDILKNNSATFYFTLADETLILSGANVLVKTGNSEEGQCNRGAIVTCENYCDDVPEGPCTRTQGYWKTHGPGVCGNGNNSNEWNVTSMTLGAVVYTDAQLCSIFNTAPGTGPKANGLITLAHQLIAAKLNVANGVTASADVLAAIAAADTMIGSLVVPPVGKGYLKPSVVSSLVETLTPFNESGSDNCD